MKPFRVSRIVEFGETDMAGIVHFSNFFRYMEAAECALLRSLGLGVTITWEGERIGFPRVSATCDYKVPARFEDVLDIDVVALRVGAKSVTFGFDFSCRGQKLAQGKVTSVCCRVHGEHQLKAVDIPASYRARLLPWLVTSDG